MIQGKILLVEDDSNFSFIMKRMIESKEYYVVTADCVEDAVEKMKKESFDLILLDMMLPDGYGTDLCQKIRTASVCPIIFVSCLSDTETKIKALQLGGDDYITKPVDFDELITRIEVNIRRARQYNLGRSLSEEERFGGFLVNKSKHEVWLTNQEEEMTERVDLSPIEYQLLCTMMERPNQLILYQELYQKVWNADDLGDVRTVMVHVSNLRKKLGESGKETIRTVRGAGYIFES
jgi:DNA-binding response OmpR family regulator